MIETVKKFVFIVLKYASPLFLVLVPMVAIYGFMVPWPPIESELAKHPDSIAILSGVSAHYQGGYEKVTKSYLLVSPKALESRSLSLTIDSKGLRELHQEEGGFITMVISYGFLAFCTYWFWVRRAHNKSAQSDAAKPRGWL